MRHDLLLEFGMLMISLGGVCYDGRESVQVVDHYSHKGVQLRWTLWGMYVI